MVGVEGEGKGGGGSGETGVQRGEGGGGSGVMGVQRGGGDKFLCVCFGVLAYRAKCTGLYRVFIDQYTSHGALYGGREMLRSRLYFSRSDWLLFLCMRLLYVVDVYVHLVEQLR